MRSRVLVSTVFVLSVALVHTARADHTGSQGQSAFNLGEQARNIQDGPLGRPRPWSLPGSSIYSGKRDTSNSPREQHRIGPLPWEDGQEPIKESFAGHFPIRSWQQDGYHGETSMFYWFFPAIKPKVGDPPLLIWLQGGPGSSSMIGLFFENGPIQVTENMKLARRSVSWADEYSILFIDQPVGTGYSYVTRTKDGDSEETMDRKELDKEILKQLQQELERDQLNEQQLFSRLADKDFAYKIAASREENIRSHAPLYKKGYCKDERGVAEDLLNFLDQFYERYPEQQNVDLYLTGESYAGKYVPSFAYGIMERNKKNRRSFGTEAEDTLSVDSGFAPDNMVIPLKGMALGNTLTDPISQVQIHADHAYYLGLITRAQADQMRLLQDQSVKEAQQGRFLASSQYRLEMFDIFKNSTGGVNWYDIRKGSIPNDWSRMESFMNMAHVKDALNVYGPRRAFLEKQRVPEDEIQKIEQGRSQTQFVKDPLVFQTISGDLMKSTAWMVSSLLDQGIKVVAYQGLFDFRDGVAGSHKWIEDLEWYGQKAFLEAERELWMVDGHLAGYVTQVKGLSRVTILGAGHLAPMDQNANSLAMIRDLVDGVGLETETVEAHSQRTSAHII